MRPQNPDESGPPGEDNGVKFAAIEFRKACIDVAPQKADLKIRAVPAQLAAAAQTRCAEACALSS